MAFICMKCGSKFTQLKLLSRHMQMAHQIGDTQKFKCGECGKSYSNKPNLKRHLNTHRSRPQLPEPTPSTSGQCPPPPPPTPAPPKYQCPYCGFWCSLRGMGSHLKSHGSNVDVRGIASTDQLDMDLTCPTCGTHFMKWKYLKHHITMKHKNGEKEKFTCPECNKSFATKYNLNRHSSVCKHYPPRTPKHQCTVCGKSYCWRSSLYWHMKSHDSAKLDNQTPSSRQQFTPSPPPECSSSFDQCPPPSAAAPSAPSTPSTPSAPSSPPSAPSAPSVPLSPSTSSATEHQCAYYEKSYSMKSHVATGSSATLSPSGSLILPTTPPSESASPCPPEPSPSTSGQCPPAPPRYQCPCCVRSFSSLIGFRRHVTYFSHEQPKLDTQPTPGSQQPTTPSPVSSSSPSRCSLSPPPKHHCEYCEKLYSSKSSLMKSHDVTGRCGPIQWLGAMESGRFGHSTGRP